MSKAKVHSADAVIVAILITNLTTRAVCDITGVVAYVIYAMAVVTGTDGAITGLTPFGNFMYASAFKWVLFLAPLGMVFFLSARINSMSLGAAQISFWLFSALMGASLSSIFIVYAGQSIAQVYYIN